MGTPSLPPTRRYRWGDEAYKVYKIVDYDPTRSDGKYFLVAWADADEDGKAYPDSWEPTKFVGKELRDAFFSDKQEPTSLRRRSPTSARDASRQSRVGCRVVSECHRHAIRLRRAGDAYRVDGSLHVDRRAERCSATACAAHVCRRSWRARQQLWVS